MRTVIISSLITIQSVVLASPAVAATARKPVELHGPDSAFRSYTIKTARGNFKVSIATLARDQFDMITAVGERGDCVNNCATKSLKAYVRENNGTIGIHGTYFCPPDYARCQSKVGSFYSPVWNSATGAFANRTKIPSHNGPLLAYADGRYAFYHRAAGFSGNPAAAIAHYPSLIESGNVIVQSETGLEKSMRANRGVRGGIGFDDRNIYLVVAQGASVVDLAAIMKSLGSTHAMNLDGGGSAALYYQDRYVFGPGRLLPNAIVFKHK